jgi:hypothetical protein
MECTWLDTPPIFFVAFLPRIFEPTLEMEKIEVNDPGGLRKDFII